MLGWQGRFPGWFVARRVSSRLLGRILPLAALLGALWVGAAAVLPRAPGALRAPPAQAACQQSRLVVLQGLATTSSDGPPYFADILNAIGGQYSGVTYFSYNLSNPQVYSQQDSLQAISLSVEALHRTIAREIAACDGVSIDLIGHSNGGVVALRYLAMYGPTTAEGSHIRHLITLDSPVNGLSADLLSSLVQTASLLGYDLSYLQSSDAIRDLIAAYNDGGTPQRNISLARSLSGAVGVLTMGSDDDLIVPYQSAAIPGFASEWSLGLVSSLCPTYVDACVGHNQILHDPGVLAKIASFLGGGTASAPPQATPPPGPPPGYSAPKTPPPPPGSPPGGGAPNTSGYTIYTEDSNANPQQNFSSGDSFKICVTLPRAGTIYIGFVAPQAGSGWFVQNRYEVQGSWCWDWSPPAQTGQAQFSLRAWDQSTGTWQVAETTANFR